MNAAPEMMMSVRNEHPRVAIPELGSNDVETWLIELDAGSADFPQPSRAVLSVDEAARADRFHFDRHRRRFVVTRGALRVLLSRHLGIDPAEVCFGYGPAGKPFVKAPEKGGALFFNVTHAENFAVVGITRAGEIGVDLERVRVLPDWEQVARATFTPERVEALRACEEARSPEMFFRAWTREEALVKALGVGLGADRTARDAAGWRVQTITLPPAFLLSLAVPLAAHVLPVRTWPGEPAPATLLHSVSGPVGGVRSICC